MTSSPIDAQRAVDQTYLDASCWIASSDTVGASPDRRPRTDKSHQGTKPVSPSSTFVANGHSPSVSGREAIVLSVQHDSSTFELLSDLTVKVKDVVLNRHLEPTRHE